ncbi:lipopolysaccharide heptosyltransferase II [bacterium]|nr:lipopolysaccharide heptosyltransferase II [bacterium]
MKILLVQTAFLGDIVLSTPVFDAVGELYPDAQVDLLTTAGGRALLTGDARFHTIHTVPKGKEKAKVHATFALARLLRKERYDVVFSLHRSFRTALLLFLARIPRRVGFHDAAAPWFYTEREPRERQEHAVLRFLSLLASEWRKSGSPIEELYERGLSLPADPGEVSLTQGSPVVLVPGSAWKTKQWNWRNYLSLATLLCDAGYSVVLAGSREERSLCERIHAAEPRAAVVAGAVDLQGFVALVRRAAGVICNDSFALHVASEAQVPTVGIFCATSPSFGFGPWKNPRAVTVEKQGLWCKPCSRHGQQRCPTASESCMRDLSPPEVFSAFRAVSSSPAVRLPDSACRSLGGI